MRISKLPNLTVHWKLYQSKMDDLITILNLVYPGETLYVCRSWYKKMLDKGYLDDLCFNLVIVNNKFNPRIPIKFYEKKKD